MGAAGVVCTVTHASVLTEDSTVKSEENGLGVSASSTFFWRLQKVSKYIIFVFAT